MNQRIEADLDTLFQQSTANATKYLDDALLRTSRLPPDVDRTAVVVAFINAAALEWSATCRVIASQNLSDAADQLADAVREQAA